MTKPIKFIMIILVIIYFSAGIVNLMAAFVSEKPHIHLLFGIVCLAISKFTNYCIIDEEDAN